MTEKNSGSKICIVLKALDSRLLDASVDDVLRIIKQERVAFKGPIPLPVDKLKVSVKSGPHIDAKSVDQYEKRTHRRIFYVSASVNFVEALSRHSLPAGVDVKIKLGGGK